MNSALNAFRSFMQQGGGGLLLPEMMLVLFAMGILLTDYLLEARDKYFNALMAMLGVIFSAITLWQLRPAAASGQAIGFSNSLLVDPFFLFFGFVFLIATALVILLSVRYLQIEDENHGEYYALILFAAVGMMFMASGFDLVVQFLGLETMAISFYVLAGFLRRDRRSNESAVKYLLLGAFSSGILAYGFSILYGLGATAKQSYRDFSSRSPQCHSTSGLRTCTKAPRRPSRRILASRRRPQASRCCCGCCLPFSGR